MNRGRRSAGYTIVETMIFLAVSAALFVSTMALIAGRQQRAQFTHSARDFETQLQDIANDVSTGYYPNGIVGGDYLNCKISSGIQLFPSSDNQGANKDCIFIGRAIQISPAGSNDEEYNVYTLVGKRQTPIGIDVSDLSESSVKVAAWEKDNDATTPNIIDTKSLPGLTFACMFYASRPVDLADKPCKSPLPVGVTKTDTLSFVSTFVAVDASGNRSSGDSHVNLYVHDLSAMPGFGNRSTYDAVKDLNHYTDAVVVPSGMIRPVSNPAGGIYICLQSGGSGQYGLLRLGGQGSRYTTDLSIKSGSCS